MKNSTNKKEITSEDYANKLVNLIQLITDLPTFYFNQGVVICNNNNVKYNRAFVKILNSIKRKMRINFANQNVQEIKINNYYFLVLTSIMKGMIGIGPFKRAINSSTVIELNGEKCVEELYTKIQELSETQINKCKELIHLADHFYHTAMEVYLDKPPIQQIADTPKKEYPVRKEKEFLELFKNGDVRSMDAYFDFRIAASLNKSSSNLRSQKNTLIVLVTTLAREAIEAGCNPEESTSLRDAIIKDIEAFNDPKKIFEVEVRIVNHFLKKIQRNRSEGLTRITKTIVNYVHNNLDDQITLNDLAKHCGRHPNYISALFKREKNMTIQQFIIEERIKKAKYLIKNSSLFLVEIAHLCGFENQSYFSYQFKNKVGCTPQEFRNMLKR